MSSSLRRWIGVVATSGLLAVGAAEADESVSLVDTMSKLQYFTHKLGLSVDSQQPRLIDFYAHEVEEVLEQLEAIKHYRDIPVAKLAERELEPRFEAFEESVESGNMASIDKYYNELLEGCNSCHRASGFDFIQVERRHDNPFMQQF